MIEQDTIRLLRECDAGVKMGISAIDEVLDNVRNTDLFSILSECKDEHLKIDGDVQKALSRFHDDGKDPNPVVKGMSWIKTNFKLVMDDSDKNVADLMISGCDMGVKSLSKYLNQYAAADEDSKSIAKALIRLEEKLSKDMRDFL